MKQHLRWLLPLVITIALIWGAVQFWNAGLAGSIQLFFGAAGAAIFAIVGGRRTWRAWRLRTGHPNGKERLALANQANQEQAWQMARRLRAELLQRQVPPQIHTWEIVTNPGEVFFIDVPADYARFYGQAVQASTSSSVLIGPPVFVVAGLALSAAANKSRQNAAIIAAQAQWREQQPARVLASNQRLLINVGGRWLNFYYSAIVAVYPEVGDWTLICQFDSAEPLRLSGIYSPLLSILSVLNTHGVQAVADHPSFKRLD